MPSIGLSFLTERCEVELNGLESAVPLVLLGGHVLEGTYAGLVTIGYWVRTLWFGTSFIPHLLPDRNHCSSDLCDCDLKEGSFLALVDSMEAQSLRLGLLCELSPHC